MKNYLYIVAIAASISAFASCSESEIENAPVSNERIEKTFGVGTPSSFTRAYIDGFDRDHTTMDVVWDPNDKVTIFAKGHDIGDTFNYSGPMSQRNNANFSGKTYVADTYWALYPAQESARLLDNGYVQFNIPAKQNATKGTFDPAAGIQVGRAGTGTSIISTRFAVSFISFHLSAGFSSVKISAKDSGWYLSGTVTADAHSNGTSIKSFVNCTNSVELVNINGEEGDYVIAFIPTTDLKEGFSVDFQGKSMHLDYTFSQQFNAGNVYELGSF